MKNGARRESGRKAFGLIPLLLTFALLVILFPRAALSLPPWQGPNVIHPGVSVCDAGFYKNPTIGVAEDSEGNLHAVWYDCDSERENTHVYYSRKDAAGWSAPEAVTPAPADTEELANLRIDVDGNGRPVVMWSIGSVYQTVDSSVFRVKTISGWTAGPDEISCLVSDFAVSNGNTVYAAAGDFSMYALYWNGSQWVQIPGLELAAGMHPWSGTPASYGIDVTDDGFLHLAYIYSRTPNYLRYYRWRSDTGWESSYVLSVGDSSCFPLLAQSKIQVDETGIAWMLSYTECTMGLGGDYYHGLVSGNSPGIPTTWTNRTTSVGSNIWASDVAVGPNGSAALSVGSQVTFYLEDGTHSSSPASGLQGTQALFVGGGYHLVAGSGQGIVEYYMPVLDADADGMLDDWENTYSCVMANTVDDEANPDGDAYTNLEEFINNGDPCSVAECSDGTDNDGDTYADLLDPGCDDLSDNDELGAVMCDNGIDDDGDGYTDYPDDFNCTSPAYASERVNISPQFVGSENTSYYALDVVVSDGYAYVADGSWGLRVIDISSPESPSLVATYDTDYARGVKVKGNYAYVAEGYVGLRIIDVSAPASPSLVATYGTGDARGVYVAGNYAYVADYDGLRIIDVTDPATPSLVGAYESYSASSVHVMGEYAYLAKDFGLQVIGVSNPAGPSLVGSYNTPLFSPKGIYASGNYAYLVCGSKGLQIFDVSNPAAPTLVGSYDTSGEAYDVHVEEGLAFVADDSSGLLIFDVFNPANPALVASYNTPGQSRGVYFSAGYAYVADYHEGLQIIFIDGWDTDGDGMPDDWENAYSCMMAYTVDGGVDYDVDGLTNLEEYHLDFDPCDPDMDEDGDLDGADNCPLISNAGQENADGDSLGNACDDCPYDPDNDADADGVCGDADNCPVLYNPNQSNLDGDSLGDLCDDDDDNDGVSDGADNCPALSNPGQENADGDSLGDACDDCPYDPDNDADADAVCGDVDNCPVLYNPNQSNLDGDSLGDLCDDDDDNDGVSDGADNCPALSNPGQENADGDSLGDACDDCPYDPDNDADADGVCGDADNCPALYNPNQSNLDGDSLGDLCDDDDDNDGVSDGVDNCPALFNPGQENADGDSLGDACDDCPYDPDNDADADAVCGDVDNCPALFNTGQENADGDSLGDACDDCPYDTDNDADEDGVCGDADNCPALYNPNQSNLDGDSLGDLCDDDDDNDGVSDGADNCPALSNPGQENADGDSLGDACDDCPYDTDNDSDEDGVCGDADNCPALYNPNQSNLDGDSLGDLCDDDDDNDGVSDGVDNCPALSNPGQENADGDSLGDACDDDDDNDGMPDAWENAYSCMMPNTVDDAANPDGDAFANLEEYQNNGDPCSIAACSDGVDNDGDTFIDLLDPGCDDLSDGDELSTAACDNGLDDDSDGHTDYPDDPECSSPSDDSEFTFIAPELVGTYNSSDHAWDVSVSNGYAYMAGYDTGLAIIDVSDPSSPSLLGQYYTSQAFDVQVIGQYAYVADGTSGLRIIDVSSPASPALTGTYDTDYASGAFFAGNYAYVADHSLGLRIINVVNPAHPIHISSYNTSGTSCAVHVIGAYAYLADGYRGLQIINVASPASPTLVSTCDTPSYARGVYVSGNYAYVADKDSGLQIIDVSNPASPNLVGSYDTPGSSYDVEVASNLAFVADYESGLQIIDVSTPANPTLVGFYDTPGKAQGVYYLKGYAYVADGQSGLQIILVDDADQDGDGMIDIWENAYDCMMPDTVDDAEDYDADSVINSQEYSLGLDPCDPDTDNGGESDGTEISLGHNPVDQNDDDHDLDGMPSVWENAFDCMMADTVDDAEDYDADSVINSQEYSLGLDPCDPDTDDGGENDGSEVAAGRDPRDPDDDDNDEDSLTNAWEFAYPCMMANTVDAEVDYDGDGLWNVEESYPSNNTDPCDPDTDGGGESDGSEVINARDPLDPSDDAFIDGDGDGMPDGWELTFACVMVDGVDDAVDADGDGLDNYDEYIVTTDPCHWDSDGDGLPDGFEVDNSVGHGDTGLDPLSAGDGLGADFDGDGIENAHEYYNGTDIWEMDVTGGASCFSWGDAGNTVSADGLVSPLDMTALKNRIIGNDASYLGVLPPNGDSQRMMGDPAGVSPLDLSVIQAIISGNDTASNPTIPTDLVVDGATSRSVAEGATTRVTVSVINSSAIGYSSSFGVVFEIDPRSTGAATLLGGEGPSGTGRYDVSGAMDAGGLASIVVRVDAPGTIYINATIPPCGDQSGKGRYCPEIEKAPAVTIVGY